MVYDLIAKSWPRNISVYDLTAIDNQTYRLTSPPRVIDKDRTTGLSQKQGRSAPPVFSQGYCAAERLDLGIDPTRTSREDRYQFLRQLHRQMLWSADKQI